ncbi:MAG: PEP-CTERM sorting domain-containing protein [Verrucomicrobiaceae bacterium]|nr:MAG: PEP-CTERM sorting domain-containing protein [Verrucomicrobiaceae bacterium]
MKPKFLSFPSIIKAINGTGLATAVFFCGHSALAANGNWNVDAAGTWSTATNWSSNPTVPGTTAGDVVSFSNNIAAARTATIDGAVASRTVGTLNIGDADNTHGFTLAASGGGTLTFNNSGAGAFLNETGSVTDTISAAVVLADNLTINAAGVQAAGSGLTLSGIISETGGAKVITVGGTGAVNLSGANTYSGGTILNSGQLHIGNNSALGTGTVTVNGGAFLPRTAPRTLANAILVGADFSVGATGYNNEMNFSGAVNLGGVARTITVADTTIDPDSTFSGVISNGGLTKAGSGRMVLSGVNTYAGDTTVSAGILTIGGAGQLGSGNYAGNISNSGSIQFNSSANQVFSGVISGSGTLTKNTSATSVLSLTGANTFSGNTVINAGGGAIAISHGSALGTGIVNIGANPGTDSVAKLQLSNNITVANAMNLAGGVTSTRLENVSGSNTISGAVNFAYVGGGTTNIVSSAGTLNLTGNLSAVTVTGARTFTFSGAGDVNSSGVISDGSATVGVVKAGGGTLTLGGNSTYAGATTVSGGTLLVNGSLGNSASVNVTGGTLGGNGSITNGITIGSSAVLSPGPAIDSLAVGSASVSGTFLVDYDGTGVGSIDLLQVGGLLDITAATVDFNQLGAGLSGAYHIFATYGSISPAGPGGGFANVVDLPDGYSIDYAFNDGVSSNNIALVAVPEPAVSMLLGVVGSFCLLRRRRA